MFAVGRDDLGTPCKPSATRYNGVPSRRALRILTSAAKKKNVSHRIRSFSLSKKVTNRWPFSRKRGENMVE